MIKSQRKPLKRQMMKRHNLELRMTRMPNKCHINKSTFHQRSEVKKKQKRNLIDTTESALINGNNSNNNNKKESVQFHRPLEFEQSPI